MHAVPAYSTLFEFLYGIFTLLKLSGSHLQIALNLTHFFPMFPFDPPQNIRKPQGGQKGTRGRNGLIKYVLFYSYRTNDLPLLRPGRIYGQRTNLMGLYSRGGLHTGGAYIREEKHFNVQSVTLTFLSFFSSIKNVFWHFSRRARCEICS